MDNHVDDGSLPPSFFAFLAGLPMLVSLPDAKRWTGLTENALDSRVRAGLLPRAMVMGNKQAWLASEIRSLIACGPQIDWPPRLERPAPTLRAARLASLRLHRDLALAAGDTYDRERIKLEGNEPFSGSGSLRAMCREKDDPLVWWALNYTYGTVRRDRCGRIVGLLKLPNRRQACYRRTAIVAFNLNAQIVRTERDG